MADLVLTQYADRYPVGTVVSLHAGRPRDSLGAVITTDTVAADGSLTVAEGDMTTGGWYTLAATVDGQVRQTGFRRLSTHTAGTTWKDTVAARRTAIGTS